MINVNGVLIEHFIEKIKANYFDSYGLLEPEFPNIACFTAKLVLENLASCDAPYHNLEHTILVTDVGMSILRGRHLETGEVSPSEWLHAIIAMLCHDIGYVRGVCKGDTESEFVVDANMTKVSLKRGSTDASLQPYHVNRSKLFVNHWFKDKAHINHTLIEEYIELTRFPVPNDPFYKQTETMGGIVRAADLIGQLGDLHYLRKSTALFIEFKELEMNEKMGYFTSADLREKYPTFFWNTVSPLINPALKFLKRTHEGRIWISALYAHVFAEEHMNSKFKT